MASDGEALGKLEDEVLQFYRDHNEARAALRLAEKTGGSARTAITTRLEARCCRQPGTASFKRSGRRASWPSSSPMAAARHQMTRWKSEGPRAYPWTWPRPSRTLAIFAPRAHRLMPLRLQAATLQLDAQKLRSIHRRTQGRAARGAPHVRVSPQAGSGGRRAVRRLFARSGQSMEKLVGRGLPSGGRPGDNIVRP